MTMKKLVAVLSVSLLAACTTTESSLTTTAAAPVDHAHADRDASTLFTEMKTLIGTWNVVDPEGKPFPSTVALSSGGSVLREIMFPGSDHEMTNMIHMDDGQLVLTHYCAIGNQPRLKAKMGTVPHQITFVLDHVSNGVAKADHYMGAVTFSFLSSNRVNVEWTSFDKGGVNHKALFKMARQGT